MNIVRKGVCAAALVLASLAALPARQQGGQEGGRTPAMFEGLRWRPIGPMRASRTCTVAGHKSHPYTFYMGVCNGGVWKTTDAGTTWTPIFDMSSRRSRLARSQSHRLIRKSFTSAAARGCNWLDLSIGDGIYDRRRTNVDASRPSRRAADP